MERGWSWGNLVPGDNRYSCWFPMGIEGQEGRVNIQQYQWRGQIGRILEVGKFSLGADARLNSTWLGYSGVDAPFTGARNLRILQSEVELRYAVSPEWSVEGVVIPGISSSWGDWGSEYFMVGARAGVRYMTRSGLGVWGGVAYMPFNVGSGLLPYIGFMWNGLPGWRTSLIGPRAQVMREIGDSLSVGLVAGFQGNNWLIRESGWTQRLEYKSFVTGPQVEWDPEIFDNIQTKFQVMIGWSFANKLHAYSRDGDTKQAGFRLDDGVFLQAGVSVKF